MKKGCRLNIRRNSRVDSALVWGCLSKSWMGHLLQMLFQNALISRGLGWATSEISCELWMFDQSRQPGYFWLKMTWESCNFQRLVQVFALWSMQLGFPLSSSDVVSPGNWVQIVACCTWPPWAPEFVLPEPHGSHGYHPCWAKAINLSWSA